MKSFLCSSMSKLFLAKFDEICFYHEVRNELFINDNGVLQVELVGAEEILNTLFELMAATIPRLTASHTNAQVRDCFPRAAYLNQADV